MTGASALPTANLAKNGDIVTVDLQLTPENGFVPESLFDTSGKLTFVLGWGNYLPGLHALIRGKRVGSIVENVSIDAGWGDRNSDLIVEVPKSRVPQAHRISRGTVLKTKGSHDVTVVDVTEDSLIIDANHPLAGSSYACSFRLLDIRPLPALESVPTGRFSVATFALGCFWGGELAFMRVPGVVGTKVGYTQGIKPNPTYEEVCSGKTFHREAILVVYDSEVVTYQDLLDVAIGRLRITSNTIIPSFMFKDDAEELNDPTFATSKRQYKNGFYFHNDEQRKLLQDYSETAVDLQVEILAAAQFYDAEDYHQQYLLKGGQSARKGCKTTIRCYG